MRQTYGAGYPRTLSSLLDWSGRNALAPAVTDARAALTREAFQDRVLRVAGGLRNAGVEAGARVAIWLPNGTDYLAAIFACARLGALAVHVNTRFRAAEVGSLLRRTRAIALVTQWGFAPVDLPMIFGALPIQDRTSLRYVLAPQSALNAATLMGLPVLPLEGRAADAGADEATGSAPCLTFTTSGTTSGPKLVLHDQQTIAGHAADVAGRIGLDAEDAVLLGAVPFCGTFGNAAAMAAVAGGAHIVCVAQFDGTAAAALIRDHRITHLIGGDDMFGRLAAASGGRPFDSVRFSGFAAFHSNAAVSIAAAEAAGLRPPAFMVVRKFRRCFRSRTERIACAAAAYRSVSRRDLPSAIRIQVPRCRMAHRESCGSTHRRASSNISTTRQQPREQSIPKARFGPATSLTLQIKASFLRRGSVTRCGWAVSWSAPRKSRPLFKLSQA
jgi:acyl-CoA synthetase (AMP-forming)/AMP-acid ligase II